MSNRKEAFERKYSREIMEYFADPKNIAFFPPELLDTYQPVECLKDTPERRLFVMRRNKDGAKGLLKITKQSIAGEAGHEASVLSKLNHPAIPKVLDYWTYGEHCFLVREYYEGQPIGYISANTKLFTPQAALQVAEIVGGALAYLEQLTPPVVNRDVKPSNIIMMHDGDYKLVDFGISRQYDPTKLHDTTYAGSDGFAPPEQYGYSQTGPAADLYGLGATLLYITTGTWDIEDGLSRIDDARLKYLVQKCCEFAPAQRFSSTAALLRSIDYLKMGFVPIDTQGKIHGSTLESYNGRDAKLMLQGISSVADNAFQLDKGDTIEAVLLSWAFSPSSISSLRQLKNLAHIIVEEEHPSLASFDGGLYSKDLRQVFFIPPCKRGKCVIPAAASFDYNGPHFLARDLKKAFMLEQIEVEPGSEDFSSVDGVLYYNHISSGGRTLVVCPRAKRGIVTIPEDVVKISEDAFHHCVGITQIEGGADLYHCGYFEGCVRLPQPYHHVWQLCPDDEVFSRCAICIRNKTPNIEVLLPLDDNPGAEGGYGTTWAFTGIEKYVEFDYALNQYREVPMPQADPLHLIHSHPQKVRQIRWISEQEVHSGVTLGTVGGWVTDVACLQDMAWIDKTAMVLSPGKVTGAARVSGYAVIEGGTVCMQALVDGRARIGTGVEISGHAHVGDEAELKNAIICDNAQVGGKTHLQGLGTKTVPVARKMTDNEWADSNEDTDWRHNYYPDMDMLEKPNVVQVSGDTMICGSTKISGDVSIDGDEVITGRFTQSFFDEAKEEWRLATVPCPASETILCKVVCLLPKIGIPCRELIITEVLDKALALPESGRPNILDVPFPPQVFLNDTNNGLIEGADYELTHDTRSYTIKMTRALQRIKAWDRIIIIYRAEMMAEYISAVEPIELSCNSTLTVNSQLA